MKSVFLITYDLTNPGKNYELLARKIKSYESWARLGAFSYLIYTDSTAVQVRDNLTGVLEANDKLFVGIAPAPAAWIGLSEEVANWIHKHQVG